MAEIFIDTRHGEFSLEDLDAQIARFPQFADRAANSALSSEGYRLQQLIRLYISIGGPPNARWPRLQPHTYMIREMIKGYRKRQWKGGKWVYGRKNPLRSKERHMEAGSGQPLLRLGSSVRYLLDKQSKLVTIGPLNQSWRGLFKLHAKGFDIDVSSARARKFHFAVRMPLAGGTTKLHVPARPVVGPVYELEKANIVRNMRLKILDNVYRYLTNKPKDYDRSVESTGITI